MGILYDKTLLTWFIATVAAIAVPYVISRAYLYVFGKGSRRDLRLGSRGNEVLVLQSRLRRKGCGPAVVNGIFDAHTECAVKDFQESRGLRITGVFDKKTATMLLRGE